VYPVVGGVHTLHDLVKESKATGPAYRLSIQTRVHAGGTASFRIRRSSAPSRSRSTIATW